MFWSLFRIFIGSGVIWKKVMFLEHFGDKRRSYPSWPSNKTGHRQSETIIDRSTAKRVETDLVPADLKPKTSLITKFPLTRFNLSIYVLCHCSRQHTLSYFLTFIQQNLGVFSRFGEKIQDSFRACYWNSIIFIYLYYAIFFISFYGLLNYVCVVLLLGLGFK